MKYLYLIRHAKSSWDNAAMKDFDRPLNTRGVKNAEQMAKRLAAKTTDIEILISSPALRAITTAETFAATFGKTSNQIINEPALYLAGVAVFEESLKKIDHQISSVAIFSHNPGITDFANTLTTVIKTDNIPTCGIFAVAAAIDSWTDFMSAEKTFLFFDYPKLIE